MSDKPYIEIVNWRKAQPGIPKSNAPWARLYTSLLDHDGFASLSPKNQLGVIAIWLYAARCGRSTLPSDPAWLMGKADFLSEPPDYEALAAATDAWGQPTPFVRFVDGPGQNGDGGAQEEPGHQAQGKGGKTPPAGKCPARKAAERRCACGVVLPPRRRVCDACKKAGHKARSVAAKSAPKGAPKGAPESAKAHPKSAPGSAKSRCEGDLEGGALLGTREEQRREEEIRTEKKPGNTQTEVPNVNLIRFPGLGLNDSAKPEQSNQSIPEPAGPAESASPQREPENLPKPEASQPNGLSALRAGTSASRGGVSQLGWTTDKLHWSRPECVAFGAKVTEAVMGIRIADVQDESDDVKSIVGAFAKAFLKEVCAVLPASQWSEVQDWATDEKVVAHTRRYYKTTPTQFHMHKLKQKIATMVAQAARASPPNPAEGQVGV